MNAHGVNPFLDEGWGEFAQVIRFEIDFVAPRVLHFLRVDWVHGFAFNPFAGTCFAAHWPGCPVEVCPDTSGLLVFKLGCVIRIFAVAYLMQVLLQGGHEPSIF